MDVRFDDSVAPSLVYLRLPRVEGLHQIRLRRTPAPHPILTRERRKASAKSSSISLTVRLTARGHLTDPSVIAARAIRNELDLLLNARNEATLPLPSYNLKLGEGHVGFRRKQESTAGTEQWCSHHVTPVPCASRSSSARLARLPRSPVAYF
jgi:hypothetical protein